MRTKKRILSMLMAVCLIVGMLPQTAFATEGATIGTSSLCEHHADHDETCGYVVGTAETPCAHECNAESGCVTGELSCQHEHDTDCGYAPAVEGHPCNYKCGSCAGQTATPPSADVSACTCGVTDGELHTEDCTLYEATAGLCVCETKCAEDAINADCPVCAAEGADLNVCSGIIAILLPLPMLAEAHTCSDADGNHQCDIYGEQMSEFCKDMDGNHYCDICWMYMPDLCEDTDEDHYCDICWEQMSEFCKDMDDDHCCDSCGNYMQALCIDENKKDHFCDVCYMLLSENCVDTERDHVCDICGVSLEHEDIDGDHFCDYGGEELSECTDSDNDHFCDTCVAQLTDCVDESHDHICDICGSVVFAKDENDDSKCDTCDAVLAQISSAKFTELNWSQTEDGSILASGKIEVMVSAKDSSIPVGRVTASSKRGGESCSFSAELDGTGKAVVSFDSLPDDFFTVSWQIQFVPTEGYTTDADSLHDVYELNINTWLDCTINGVLTNLIYLLPGTEVTLELSIASQDAVDWTFTEYGTELENFSVTYNDNKSSVTFTMPDRTVIASPNIEHNSCEDKDKDHLCDFCNDFIVQSSPDQDSDGICDYCGNSILQMQSSGETYYYCSLSFTDETISYVKLLGDIHDADGFWIYERSLTLDLNGFQISAEKNNALNVIDSDITITDSSAQKTGSIQTTQDYYSALSILDSTVTIEGGTFTGSQAVSACSRAIDTSLKITGGTLLGSVADISCTRETPIGITVDVTEYAGCEGLTFLHSKDTMYKATLTTAKELLLPENASLTDASGETVTELGIGATGTVKVTDCQHTGTTELKYDTDAHWYHCPTCGEDIDRAAHSGGTATCQEKAVCSVCEQPYGSLDGSNHTGGEEVRGKVDATPTTAGYTGDTYCLGCNTKIKTGTTIPATGSGNTGGGDNGNDDSGNDDSSGDTSNEEIPKSSDTADDTPTYVTYTVQKGDTLWAIARKYGCTVSEIVAANSDLIKNPDLIYTGWQLKIPQAGATGTDNAPDAKKTTVYIVQQGDTLWAISKKYGCNVAEIVALNGELITNPDLIFAGWELKIPQD